MRWRAGNAPGYLNDAEGRDQRGDTLTVSEVALHPAALHQHHLPAGRFLQRGQHVKALFTIQGAIVEVQRVLGQPAARQGELAVQQQIFDYRRCSSRGR